MTSTLEPAGAVTTEPAGAAPTAPALERAAGIELLGPVHGSGYADGVSLVRRADGQMLQLGPLLYGVLDAADGHRSNAAIAEQMTSELGRRLGEQHVIRIAEKLAAQGLLAGSEAAAPPRRNPLLALRWKVLVTNPTVTRRLTAPFTLLFRPWVMWPVLLAFVAVVWYVLFDKGLAGATSQAFTSPGWLLLIFALGVLSAGFHEMGHAAACRYGGATPGGMGMGLYLVWPAFYTDVTDAYRLDRRSRLRVDLAGLYFNAVIAVVVTGVWLGVRNDALLLVAGLQLLLMVKQLSPVIRADGYHILADLTGVPDLYAHIGPTLRRLVPWGRRSPSALTGKARAIVTLWVLVVIPVLLSLMVGAVLLLPRIATSAWDSGHVIAAAIPAAAGHGNLLAVCADVLRLLALFLPVVGSLLVAQRLVRGLVAKGRSWSHGHPVRRGALVVGAVAVLAGLLYAWWPSGQYQPVRPSDRGTLPAFVSMPGAPATTVRPVAAASPVLLPRGRYVALAMIPKAGVTASRPAMFVIPGRSGRPPVSVLSTETAAAATLATAPSTAPSATPAGQPTSPPLSSASPAAAPSAAPSTAGGTGSPVAATAFPFALPAAPGPGGTQALATNRTDHGVVYKVAYAVVTVSGDQPVTNTNSAFAIASCQRCTTVAVSFQLVLVVGQTHVAVPINAAGALNYDCPQCVTTAIADQMVVTLSAQPSAQLDRQLEAALQRLDLVSALGSGASPAAIAAQVDAVQQQVTGLLQHSGLLVTPSPSSTAAASPSASAATTPATSSAGQSSAAPTGSTTTAPSQASTTAPPAQRSPTTTPTPTQTPSKTPTSTPPSPTASGSPTSSSGP